MMPLAVLIALEAQNREMDRAARLSQQRLRHRLPPDSEELRGNLEIDFMIILPANTTHFYDYDGSLTTPPCTEGVLLNVLREADRVL